MDLNNNITLQQPGALRVGLRRGSLIPAELSGVVHSVYGVTA